MQKKKKKEPLHNPLFYRMIAVAKGGHRCEAIEEMLKFSDRVCTLFMIVPDKEKEMAMRSVTFLPSSEDQQAATEKLHQQFGNEKAFFWGMISNIDVISLSEGVKGSRIVSLICTDTQGIIYEYTLVDVDGSINEMSVISEEGEDEEAAKNVIKLRNKFLLSNIT